MNQATPASVMQYVCPLLHVSDLERSVRFYVATLGFVEDWRDEGGFVILRHGECRVFLAQKQREVDLRNINARATRDGFANYDLYFHCAAGSIDTLWSQYRAAGVTMPDAFAAGPVTRPYGIRAFSLFDPDGYELVFGCPVGECPE
jgi:catechol 2,3-dioxygenase-like lactoylglutathione lyase family enzyme